MNKKFKNLTIEILDALLGALEGLATASLDKKEAYRIINGISEREWTVASISKFFNSLKARKYIEVVKRNGSESIQFTNKAKLALVDITAGKMKSDKKYCFVSFDIPESMKTRRDAFRRVLKRIGFRKIQKSLWVCNKSVGNLVDLASQEFGVEDYIVYIVSDQTNINSFISDQFSKFDC